jgi:uncharacterized repeat protein (TIGR01451 family)
MTAAPATLVVGDSVTYKLTVTNNGTSAAPGVIVIDGLPTGETYVAATTGQGTTSDSGNVLTANLGTVGPGVAVTVTLVARTTSAGILTNQANVAGAVIETDPANNTAGVAVAVAPIHADLAVTITGGPDPVIVGSNVTYAVLVINNGPDGAAGVVLTDSLPAGMTYVSAALSQGTISQFGTTLTADLGALASGAAARLTVVATAGAIGTSSSTASVSSNSTDLNLANNTATLDIPVVPDLADLAAALGAAPATVAVGDNVAYTVNVTNNGPAPASDVVLTDALPAGAAYVSATPSQGTATAAGGTVTADLDSLAVGASATVTIVATASTFGKPDNIVTVTSPVSDPNPGNNTASFTVAVNVPPVDSPQSVAAALDTPLPVVLGASEPDGDPLAYTIVAGPAHGTLSGTAPFLTYTPAAGYYGADSFRFDASDGSVAGNVAAVTIAVDVPPEDASQSVVTATNEALPITLGATEPDADVVTYSITDGPAHGTLSGMAPNLTYTPAAGYYGSDRFTYHASDGPIAGNTAAVTIAVKAPPLAIPQTLAIAEGATTGIVLAASEPDGDPLAYSVVAGPAHGTLAGTAPVLIFTPAAGYYGSDLFTFQASDGPVAGNTATVNITVDAPPVNASQSVTTPVGVALPIALAASEPDGNVPAFTIVAPPVHGTLTGASPAVTYAPDAGFTGQDFFTFTSSDGPAFGNIAAVSILVAAPPVSADQSLATAAGVALPITLAASEPDGDTPGYTIVTAPAHGSLAGTAPFLTYMPAAGYSGPDSLSFTSSDGPAAGNTATVSIDVKAAPVDSGQSVVAASGQALPITLTASVADGGTPSFAVVAAPGHGTLSGTAPDFIYTPAAGYLGPDSFSFASSNGPAVGNTATVSITVTAPPVNTDPSLTALSTGDSNVTPPAAATPAPAPVAIESITLEKGPAVKHRKSMDIIVAFSGALDTALAENLAGYSLSTVPQGKQHKSRPVALAQAVYDASADIVTLTPRKALSLKPTLLLNINTNVIRDAVGAPIAGNNGQRGSAFEATLSAGSASRAATARVRP